MKNPILSISALLTMIAMLISFAPEGHSKSLKKTPSLSSTYRLGGGDKLRITVFDEEDLSGEFDVDGSGEIALPLVGNVQAGGLTLRKLEKTVATAFKDGYLINPRVSIEVLNFRPFFIMGEVKNPGSYPYVSSLTVLNAVALAGGYTHRAREDKVIIRRKGNDGKKIEAGENAKVNPGDTIRVMERFF